MKYLKYYILLALLGSLTIGCFDDKDDVVQVASTVEINDFIWKGMNTYYLYKSDVPDLANDRFSSNSTYTDFLKSFTSPEVIFDALQSDVDEFSFLVDDYITLERFFDGNTLNNGMEFGLVRYPNNPSNVYGFVRYVLPNTDAENKGIQRGNIFNTIDGTQITDQNFSQLIAPDSYTIGLATFDGTDITPTGTFVTLNKIQYTENPIFITKTLNVGGNPIGYIMYNAFTSDFDSQLNAAFAKLKSDQITDLILDVRYNGGGDTETAKDLASMITGQFNGEIFTTEQWNEEFQEFYENTNPGRLTNFFDNQIRTGEAINNLNLSRVYILTTKNSASASELLINGLNPYIQTIKVGDTTKGKFQASVTVYDTDNYRRPNAELAGHTYAMQPLVLKSINVEGFTDYFNGLAPDILIQEDFSNLGILGDENEPLLKAALDAINGNRNPKLNTNTLRAISIGNSNMFDLSYERMYTEIY